MDPEDVNLREVYDGGEWVYALAIGCETDFVEKQNRLRSITAALTWQEMFQSRCIAATPGRKLPSPITPKLDLINCIPTDRWMGRGRPKSENSIHFVLGWNSVYRSKDGDGALV